MNKVMTQEETEKLSTRYFELMTPKNQKKDFGDVVKNDPSLAGDTPKNGIVTKVRRALVDHLELAEKIAACLDLVVSGDGHVSHPTTDIIFDRLAGTVKKEKQAGFKSAFQGASAAPLVAELRAIHATQLKEKIYFPNGSKKQPAKKEALESLVTTLNVGSSNKGRPKKMSYNDILCDYFLGVASVLPDTTEAADFIRGNWQLVPQEPTPPKKNKKNDTTVEVPRLVAPDATQIAIRLEKYAEDHPDDAANVKNVSEAFRKKKPVQTMIVQEPKANTQKAAESVSQHFVINRDIILDSMHQRDPQGTADLARVIDRTVENQGGVKLIQILLEKMELTGQSATELLGTERDPDEEIQDTLLGLVARHGEKKLGKVLRNLTKPSS